MRSIYCVLFQGDRHAIARDDTLFYLSLRGSETTKQSPGRVEVYGVYSPYFFRGIAAVATLLRNDGKAIVRWDISLALDIT